MPFTLSEALKFTLAWEGGYTNHPNDRGGPTNKGITQSTYNRYLRRNNRNIQSVRSITDNEVHEIYEKDYWDVVRAKYLKSPLGLVLFDTCVNLGPGGCIRRLQAALEVPITGAWTQAISDKIHKADAGDIALKICQMRIAKRYEIVRNDKSQSVFLKGWLNRDRALIREVEKMIGANIMEIENEYDELVPEIEFENLEILSQDDVD
jgi:lysozyme family protein